MKEVRRRQGFTLIELLIVMTVIGILAMIAIPKLNVTRERAFRSALLSDLKSLAHLQDVYHNLNYRFSSDLALLEYTNSDGVTITINEANQKGWAATATHAGVTTGQCGIFYGDAAATNGDPAVAPGVMACDF